MGPYLFAGPTLDAIRIDKALERLQTGVVVWKHLVELANRELFHRATPSSRMRVALLVRAVKGYLPQLLVRAGRVTQFGNYRSSRRVTKDSPSVGIGSIDR